jgi:transposase
LGVSRELRGRHGRNFEYSLIQEVLQRLDVSKTRTTPLQPQSDGMVERYIKTVEEHLRKVAASYQRDWGVRLPIFRLAYMAYIHDNTGSTSLA